MCDKEQGHKHCQEHEESWHKEKVCKKQKEHEDYKKHDEHDDCRKSYDKEAKGESRMGYSDEKGEGMRMDGLHLRKRDLWLMAGGALGALAALGLGKISGRVRPAAVGAVREGYAFKEWLAGKAEKVKEDMEDIYAEGVHQYHSNVAATADSVKRERDILEKLEKMIDAKLAKMRHEPGEGE